MEGDVAGAFFKSVCSQARRQGLLSDEHFTLDGTLVEAWASLKSFRPKGPGQTGGGGGEGAGRNPEVDWRGQKRSNDTHASTTDPGSRLYRKGSGKEAKLCYMGHVLMENRNGLAVDTRLTLATGTAERQAAMEMIEGVAGSNRITVDGDKGYDQQPFVEYLRAHGVTPHVAQKERHSAIDSRTTRHAGYAVSQRVRNRIEESFGWLKTVGGLSKTRDRGTRKVGWMFTFALSTYNLVRMRKLGLSSP